MNAVIVPRRTRRQQVTLSAGSAAALYELKARMSDKSYNAIIGDALAFALRDDAVGGVGQLAVVAAEGEAAAAKLAAQRREAQEAVADMAGFPGE